MLKATVLVCFVWEGCLLKPKIGLAKSHLSVLNNHDFTQLIDQPTCITERSSVLDHVICNFSHKVSKSGVVPIGLSDHFMTFLYKKIVRQKYNRQTRLLSYL